MLVLPRAPTALRTLLPAPSGGPAPAAGPREPLASHRRIALFLVSVPILALAVIAWQHRWVSDDGFINFRVVDNIFAGHGPVFNAGERVEATTSVAWLMVLTIGHAVMPFLPVAWLAVLAGITSTVLGVISASAGAAAQWRAAGRTGLLLPAGMLVLAALPPMWDFATSGLETGLTFLWLGASFWLLSRRYAVTRAALVERPPAWRPLYSGLVIGSGALVRPDLVLIAVPLGLVWLLLSRPGWRSRLGGLFVLCTPPVGYEVFRMGYYASVVPNTALAKDAESAVWERGLAYLGDFAGRYQLAVPLLALVVAVGVPALVGRARRGDAAGAALCTAPVVGGLLDALFVVRVGGDFMHGRFLLPATFAVILPVAVVTVPRPLRLMNAAALALPLLVVLGWAVYTATSVRTPYSGVGPEGIANERNFWRGYSGHDHPVSLADYATPNRISLYALGTRLRDLANNGKGVFVSPNGPPVPVAPGHAVVGEVLNVGILGAAAGDRVFVADELSLADPIGARFPASPRARVGHAKQVPVEWELARYAAPTPRDPAGVRAARRALSCGDVHLLQEATSAPMTPGRFLRNLLVAPRLTWLRIPSNPFQAEAALCHGPDPRPALPTPASSAGTSSSFVIPRRDVPRCCRRSRRRSVRGTA